jgi:signal transduction histidine kinase
MMKNLITKFPYPLRVTLPLMMLGLGGAINFTFYHQVRLGHHERVEEEAKTKSELVAAQTSKVLEHLYRSQASNIGTSNGIEVVLEQVQADPQLSSVMLLDERDKIRWVNDAKLRQQQLMFSPLSQYTSWIQQVRQTRVGQSLMQWQSGEAKVAAFYPVRLEQQSNSSNSDRIGVLVVQYSLRQPMAEAEAAALRKSLISWGLVIALTIGLWAIFDQLTTKRANRLLKVGQSWAKGNFSERVILSGTDEFAKIGYTFNLMAGAIENKTREIMASEGELRTRKNELEGMLSKLKSTQSQLVQTEKMSGLGQMVAGIAHEVNNPIGFVHGNLNHVQRYTEDLISLVQLYQEQYPTPPKVIREAVTEIDLPYLQEDLPNILKSMHMGTSRVKEIVLSLRNFSRLDEAEMKAVSLHDGLDSTLLILQHRFKSLKTSIIVQKDYGVLPLVYCHAGQVNQVFMNILANAIDALSESISQRERTFKPEIRIITENLPNNRVGIRIIDNGLGIPEAVQSKLFDPFFTTKEVGKGTGLGLSISYQIVVEKHRGQLICHSKPNQGTEFRIELPVSLAPKAT